MIDEDFARARERLPEGAWVALEEAHLALRTGGLPCGAALSSPDGVVVARGRNHAYDPPSGTNVLEGTPLAHAELNVLAMVPTDRELGGDTLWSTQQPCSMCTAACEFCGVGSVGFLSADPSFVGTSDARAGRAVDPADELPTGRMWAVLATVMFLQPAVVHDGADHPRVRSNMVIDPDATQLALDCADGRLLGSDLENVLASLWPDLLEAVHGT